MAHATINFEFESIASVASQQEVEFGVFFVTWNMRLRGMKDPSVSKAVEERPVVENGQMRYGLGEALKDGNLRVQVTGRPQMPAPPTRAVHPSPCTSTSHATPY